jgi:hypothetical protein
MMFSHQPCPTLGVLAGTPRIRLDKHLDRPGGRHPKQAEAQEATEFMCTWITHTTPAPGRAYSKPDLITGGSTIHALQHEFETEGQFQLADYNDRRLLSTERNEITAADFTL